MKKKIAIVTGGLSGESVISYKSAHTIEQHLDRNRYEVFVIDIHPEGWFFKADNESRIPVNKNDFTVSLEDGNLLSFDAVLLALHGTPGEDGKLQGYFDMVGLPYTGCDAATSAITFNKRYAVAVARMAGIGVASSLHLFNHTPVSPDTILSTLQLPLFIKPNNGGSSIGMSKVLVAEELSAALDKAFLEDTQVLVEEMIQGREFTVGVYKSKGIIQVLPITEVKAHSNKVFFDFEAKYEGHATEITPAVVDASKADKIRATARQIYEVFNCGGVVRIDFIYNEAEDRPYMLEINTIPGQSGASIVPQQVVASGSNLTDFYTLLVEECFS